MVPAASSSHRGDIPLRVSGVFKGRANFGEADRFLTDDLFFARADSGWLVDFAMTISFRIAVGIQHVQFVLCRKERLQIKT